MSPADKQGPDDSLSKVISPSQFNDRAALLRDRARAERVAKSCGNLEFFKTALRLLGEFFSSAIFVCASRTPPLPSTRSGCDFESNRYMRRWLIGTCSFAAFFFAVTYPPSVQHADSRLATLVGFAVSLAAEEKSAKVQVGDLVLAIPAALGPAFAPERSGVATSFDYSKVAPALAGVRRVDSIYIKLHQLWPMQDRSTNEVVAIQANSRATSVDFYCRSKGRKGFESDAGAAARSDGEFVVFEDQSTVGTVYMSSSTRAFGAPLTARKGERGAFSWEGNGKTPIALFSFRIALTPDVNLVIRFTEKQLPRVQWPGFFEKLDATLRSWMSVPDPSTFKWYHEQMSACDPAR